MIDPGQFRLWIVKPTLTAMGMWSSAAENLLVGTALVESDLTFIKQKGGGPAVGLFQMEPATAMDIAGRYLRDRFDMEKKLISCAGPSIVGDWANATEEEISGRIMSDMRFACAMARIKYWMDPEPLPDETNLEGLGRYWKRVYNTDQGAGEVHDFVSKYRRAENVG